MSGYKIASRFISRVVIGSILAIVVGNKVDEWLNTPIVLIGLLMYVIIGSLILLVKEITDGRKD